MKYLRTSVLFILFFFLLGNLMLQAQTLSDRAEISLITCNPGEDLYSVFGHSAIRVRDYDKGIDWVYNYGTFDFGVPNFYVKFVRGYLNYQLAVYNMSDFVREYQAENRSIYEQVLELGQDEKEEVFSFLEFNRLPENKFYMYDFFFDNCATRIRDVFQKELNEDLKFQNKEFEDITFREMIKPYLLKHPWSRFGINLVLGAVADRKATLEESMFLPDYMYTAFKNASIRDSSETKNYVRSSKVLFEEIEKDNTTLFFSRPGFVFWTVLTVILIFTFMELKRKVNYKIIDFAVFLSIGLIGTILFLMWFATNHTAVVKNWNLMWAIPTHLILAFFVFRKSKSEFLKYYFLITGITTLSTLPFWPLIPQQYDFAFIPLILLSAVRSFKLFQFYK